MVSDIVVDVLCTVDAVEGGGGRNNGEIVGARLFEMAPGKADAGNGSSGVLPGLDSSSADDGADGLMGMLLGLGSASAASKADESTMGRVELCFSSAAIKANASILAVLVVGIDEEVVVAIVVVTLQGSPSRSVFDVRVGVVTIAGAVVVVATIRPAPGPIGPVSIEVMSVEVPGTPGMGDVDSGATPSCTLAQMIMSVARL